MMSHLWKKNGLVWTAELSVGNAIVDAEHRNLIHMASDAVEAIRSQNTGGLSQSLDTMAGWLPVHFSNEERIARAISFDFSSHRLAQQKGMSELQSLMGQLLDGNRPWPVDAVDYLTRFFRKLIIDDHIIGLDMQMKPALQACGYDFWPGLKLCNDGQKPSLRSRYPIMAERALA